MKKKVTPTVCERIQFIKNRIKEILVDWQHISLLYQREQDRFPYNGRLLY